MNIELLCNEYRENKRMIEELRTQGFKKASLSVQKTNYAVHLYNKVGFKVYCENEEEFIMICHLQ